MKSNGKRSFHFNIYDGSVMNIDESKFDVVFEVRGIIASEFGIDSNCEFDEFVERSSYHFIGTSIYILLSYFSSCI